MNFSSGLVRAPVEDLDFDGQLLHVFGAGEGKVVERLNFYVVFDDFLDDWNHEVVAFFHDGAADAAAQLVEDNGSLARVDLVDEGGRRRGQGEADSDSDKFVWGHFHVY